MTLETRFSLEEMEYLKGLDCVEVDHPFPEIRKSWTRARDRKEWQGASQECAVRGCDTWQHISRGYVYLKHNEGLVKEPYPTEPSEFSDWIDAIHAHETAVLS